MENEYNRIANQSEILRKEEENIPLVEIIKKMKGKRAAMSIVEDDDDGDITTIKRMQARRTRTRRPVLMRTPISKKEEEEEEIVQSSPKKEEVEIVKSWPTSKKEEEEIVQMIFYWRWGPGVAILVLSWIITLYTLWQMVEMHEIIPGKRLDRYHELGQAAFGEKLGLRIVVPLQAVVEVSTCIVYMVTGGKSLMKFQELASPNSHPIGTTWAILIFGSCHFCLSFLPNFNSISGVSLAAAIMSFCYSLIAWTASAHKGPIHLVDYAVRGKTTSDNVLNFFSAMGNVAFAFAGHNVVLEIQATIPSTPENPSKKPMWRGVIVAYVIVALCYFPVAFVGYYVFGNTVDDNILITLQKPNWLIAMANLFVVIHVIGGYQIYAIPLFDMTETYLVKEKKFKPSKGLRLLVRFIFVALTIVIAMAIPFFGALLGFFGGLALAPTTYFLPCFIWLWLVKPQKFGLSWWINWTLIVLGVLLMTLATIGGGYSIVTSYKTYRFFS